MKSPINLWRTLLMFFFLLIVSSINAAPDNNFVQKSTSSILNVTCGVLKSGKVECLGDDKSLKDVPSDLGNVKEVSVGDYHACALLQNGKVRCWGSNAESQLTTPEELKDIVHITAFSKSTCAFNKKADITCWGDANNQNRSYKSRLKKVQSFLFKIGPVTSLKCNGLFTVTDSVSAIYQCTKKGKEENITLKFKPGEYPYSLQWKDKNLDKNLDIGLLPSEAHNLFKTDDYPVNCSPSYSWKYDVDCYLGDSNGYIYLFNSGDVVSVVFRF